MRDAPICPLPDYFVAYEDSKKRYVEVNFEKKVDAAKYMKRLEKRGVESELWTRQRSIAVLTAVFPEVK